MYPKTIQDRFYKDPEWYQVEELVNGKIAELLDIKAVDTKQSAEAVKAELIGRNMAADLLTIFVRESKIVTREPKIKNNFR